MPTFEIFSQIVTQCTENYECIVIDNTTKSNDLADQLYWYRAEIHPEFRIGAKEFWQLSAATTQEESDDDEEELYNVEVLRKSKKGPAINVQKTIY